MLGRIFLVFCLAGEFTTVFGNKDHQSLMFWDVFYNKDDDIFIFNPSNHNNYKADSSYHVVNYVFVCFIFMFL